MFASVSIDLRRSIPALSTCPENVDRLSTDGYNQRLQRCKAVDSGWLEALRLLKRMKARNVNRKCCYFYAGLMQDDPEVM